MIHNTKDKKPQTSIKSFIILAAILLLITLVILLIKGSLFIDPSIKSIQNLSAANITSIEMVTMPSDEDSRYKRFDPDEFAEPVALLHGAKGRFIENPEPLSGGATTFYIMEDNGDKYEISNVGNTYLVIDGRHFKSDDQWLSEWSDFKTDSVMPLMLDYEKTDAQMAQLEARLQTFKEIEKGTHKSDVYKLVGQPLGYTSDQNHHLTIRRQTCKLKQ